MPFGSTSSTTSSTTSPYAGPLAAMGKSEWQMAKPLLGQLGSQFMEALRTGGVNSFLPWITRALDTVRQSSSQGIEGLRENLARTGQASSSIGQEEIQTAQTSAGNTANRTPSDMIMQFIQGAPAFAQGLANSGIGATGAAAGATTSSTGTSTPSFWSQFLQGVQSGAVGASGSNFGVP